MDNRTDTANTKKMISPLMVFVISFLATIAVTSIVLLILVLNGVDILGKNSKNVYDSNNEQKVVDDADDNEDWVDIGDATEGSPVYNYKYSYAELPNVVSVDSDGRFIYSTKNADNGVVVYSYLFNEENATIADFYQACEDYSILLQKENGFVYQKEYSEEQYENTKVPANYLTKGDIGISVTASVEDSLYYAYIIIFPLYMETTDEDTQTVIDMPNYNAYLAGREKAYFTYDEMISMENGISFAIYDVIARLPGDGTIAIDIMMDISSWYEDYYLNNGDFMILPVDSDNNIISDAIPTSYITDSAGNNVPMPFLVSTSSYVEYTLTYAVPSNTAAFSIYASNVYGDDYYGPVYVMDVGYK
jgi:hypothetical protein